ncbi:MAG: hypothetical protein AB9869_14075 [Verrucomicrobiia bacterium]
MPPDLHRYLAVFLTGLAVTLAATPLVKKLAIRFGAVDMPDARRPHARPTPRGGGLAVVLGVHAACLVSLALSWSDPKAGLDLHFWLYLAAASLILVVVGIIDDARGLRPLFKLAGQCAAGGIIVLSGLRFGRILDFDIPPAVDSVVAILWIVGVINAFNLIDGMDGLASGLAAISAVGLGGMLILGTVHPEVILLAGLLGACIGFLRYNFYPASVFLGDTGSMFLGFVLAVVSMTTWNKHTFMLSFCIPLLVLGIPIFDEVLAIWRRSVRAWSRRQQAKEAGGWRGIFEPDVEHLHHRLVEAGFTARRGALLLWAINAGLVAVGLLMVMFRSHAAGIFLIALLGGVYVLLRNLAAIELRDTGRMILTGLRRPTPATFTSLLTPLWDMSVMAGSLALGIWMISGWQPGFWHAWFLELPIWVTPTFSLIAASRVYDTIWSRLRPLDVLMLCWVLSSGLLLSLAVALLIDPLNVSDALLRALFVGAISHPAILAVRVFYRSAEECVLYLRNRSELRANRGKILLYGAGGRCQLFLRERGYINSGSFEGGVIVGLLDDEPALHGRWVYGYQVLGGLRQAAALIDRHKVTSVILTANLLPENLRGLEQIARTHPVQLSEWTFGRHPLETKAEDRSQGPSLVPLGPPSAEDKLVHAPGLHLLAGSTPR